MAGLIVRIVEDERERLARICGLERVAELARETLGADDLEIRRAAGTRTAAGKVARRSSTDHVLIDLADDRIDRHGRVIRVPARPEQSRLFASMAHEENRATRTRAARQLLRDLEDRHGPGAVVIRAIPDRVEPRRIHLAQAVEDRTDLPPFVFRGRT